MSDWSSDVCSSDRHEVERLDAGIISMVSQSGGVGTGTMSLARKAGFPFRILVSSGNEAVVSFADYLNALVDDEGTKIIAGYLEGVRDGEKFARALERARDKGKPVVLIKAGVSPASDRKSTRLNSSH